MNIKNPRLIATLTAVGALAAAVPAALLGLSSRSVEASAPAAAPAAVPVSVATVVASDPPHSEAGYPRSRIGKEQPPHGGQSVGERVQGDQDS